MYILLWFCRRVSLRNNTSKKYFLSTQFCPPCFPHCTHVQGMHLQSRSAFQWLCILVIPTAAALNYLGGFDSTGRCVGICTNTRSTPTCFDPLDTVCLAKKQQPGDWDYVVLDQFFLPQLCRDLEVGESNRILV